MLTSPELVSEIPRVCSANLSVLEFLLESRWVGGDASAGIGRFLACSIARSCKCEGVVDLDVVAELTSDGGAGTANLLFLNENFDLGAWLACVIASLSCRAFNAWL